MTLYLFSAFWFDGKKDAKVPIWDVDRRKRVQKSHYTVVVSKTIRYKAI